MNSAPHNCPECGCPAYLGFGVPARCVSPYCAFYDEDICMEFSDEVIDRSELSKKEQLYLDEQLGLWEDDTEPYLSVFDDPDADLGED